MSQNFFEKNPKLVLISINLIFVLVLVWIFRLEIFQDAQNSEKYSLYNKLEYSLRCGKRNIARQVARGNNILLIDLEREIPMETKYLYDAVHFTNEGSKLVAKIVSEKLQNLTKKHVSH